MNSTRNKTILSVLFLVVVAGAIKLERSLSGQPIWQQANQQFIAGQFEEGIRLATMAIEAGDHPVQSHFIRASCIYQRTFFSGVVYEDDLDIAEDDYRYALRNTSDEKVKANCVECLCIIYSIRAAGLPLSFSSSS